MGAQRDLGREPRSQIGPVKACRWGAQTAQGHLPNGTIVVACRMPARGPESNSAVTVREPTRCDWGTRTEAVQNVPQAKPEWAMARF
jgi:hypothetical protein